MAQCLHIMTELQFCIPPLVVGYELSFGNVYCSNCQKDVVSKSVYVPHVTGHLTQSNSRHAKFPSCLFVVVLLYLIMYLYTTVGM